MSTVDQLQQQFGSAIIRTESFRDNVRVIVTPEAVHEVLKHLKESLGFNMLAELTAVDYLNYPDAVDRFGVIYGLTNLDSGERIFVKTYLNEPDLTLPTVCDLWQGANWLEREVYDMFGITFAGHPDLRRILMPEEFVSFPLRKDYPLRGKHERHNFPVITRAES